MPQTSALRARLESLFVRALAGLEIFKDAGHLPQLDDPLRFIDALEDFVASTNPSTFSTERWTELLRSHGERIET